MQKSPPNKCGRFRGRYKRRWRHAPARRIQPIRWNHLPRLIRTVPGQTARCRARVLKVIQFNVIPRTTNHRQPHIPLSGHNAPVVRGFIDCLNVDISRARRKRADTQIHRERVARYRCDGPVRKPQRRSISARRIHPRKLANNKAPCLQSRMRDHRIPCGAVVTVSPRAVGGRHKLQWLNLPVNLQSHPIIRSHQKRVGLRKLWLHLPTPTRRKGVRCNAARSWRSSSPDPVVSVRYRRIHCHHHRCPTKVRTRIILRQISRRRASTEPDKPVPCPARRKIRTRQINRERSRSSHRLDLVAPAKTRR